MKNKILRSILSISVLSLGLELYHSHHQEIEGYFYCNVDCSNNDHHETAHDCYYCTHQNNLNLAEYVKQYRNYGSKIKYKNNIKGVNSRIDEIQAAILNIKLNYLESFIKKRKKIGEVYCKTISNDQLRLPFTHKNSVHTFNQFTIRV